MDSGWIIVIIILLVLVIGSLVYWTQHESGPTPTPQTPDICLQTSETPDLVNQEFVYVDNKGFVSTDGQIVILNNKFCDATKLTGWDDTTHLDAACTLGTISGKIPAKAGDSSSFSISAPLAISYSNFCPPVPGLANLKPAFSSSSS